MTAGKMYVAGAGGFIGGHLVKRLVSEGYDVIAVDIKPIEEWEQIIDGVQNIVSDLRSIDACRKTIKGVDTVFNLAADMGGMGFIETHKAECMMSVLISTNLLWAARDSGVARFFYSSSACVYNADRQKSPLVTALREEDAYPADPEDGYGWEKLFSERMARHFLEDFGLQTRVARFHNVYGPNGTWQGGREKAPAAVCRKIAEVSLGYTNEIEIWGDGRQTRSFTYIDDCVDGILKITRSDIVAPINLGSSELVSINELVSIVEDIAQVKAVRKYDLSAPQGVRGRNSDNSMIINELGWEPNTKLRTGLRHTYNWVMTQILSSQVVHG